MHTIPGPCAKQVVTATIISPRGEEYIGTNFCYIPQETCPRQDMPTGKGYHLCRSICLQHGHAELSAIELAGEHAKGATLYLQGHSYACEDCQAEAKEAGIVKIVIGPPPLF